MRMSANYFVLAVSFVSFQAFAACENPAMILTVPVGESATMDEMLAAQTEVKTYMENMETYLACLNEELDAAGDDTGETFRTLMVTRYNTAVVELESVAATFNEQLQAYRAENPSEE
jgi:hypothetical protein